MKTADLEGVDLDYWVAKARGWIDYPSDSIEQGRYWHTDPARAPFGLRVEKHYFRPSTAWAQGGPIIACEKIASWASGDVWRALHPSQDDLAYYDADLGVLDADCVDGFEGPTPLIAAMRAYVALKFGDEVPDTDTQ